MNFHILGLGPIGSLLAYHLRRSVPSSSLITLLHKSLGQSMAAQATGGFVQVERDALVSSARGFQHEAFDQPFLVDAIPNYEGNETNTARPSSGHIDSLFVACKAHQARGALTKLQPRLSPHSTVVLLNNGMGVHEMLLDRVFRNPSQRPHFILVVNNHGAFGKRPLDIIHTGVGNIEFGVVPDSAGRDFEAGFREIGEGRLSDLAPQDNSPAAHRYRSLQLTIASLLRMEDLSCSWRSMAEIQIAMRRKVVVNSVINPLTAILNCRNGDVLRPKESQRVMSRVCQEAYDGFVAQMKAETTMWLNDQEHKGVDPDSVSVGRVPRGLTRDSLEAECLRIAKLTKGNISSMLSDIRRGKETEIDFTNGYLLSLGSQYRVEMPANATLFNLVKARSQIPLDQMM